MFPGLACFLRSRPLLCVHQMRDATEMIAKLIKAKYLKSARCHDAYAITKAIVQLRALSRSLPCTGAAGYAHSQ